jgi:hypothetical protein
MKNKRTTKTSILFQCFGTFLFFGNVLIFVDKSSHLVPSIFGVHVFDYDFTSFSKFFFFQLC